MRSMPMPQPTAGVRLAAELLEQAVVAAAAADRALRAEAIGDPLEHGQVVVVEAAHQARIDAVGEPGGVEHGAHARRSGASDSAPRKSISRGAPSTIACIAGFLLSRMRSGLLCRRRRAVLVERVGVLLEVGDQRGAVGAALVGLAEAVDLEANVACRRRGRGRAAARGTSGSARRRRRGRRWPSASTSIWWNWR